MNPPEAAEPAKCDEENEPSSPKSEEKKTRKEKTPKKERVHSMSIMNFLKHKKEPEVPAPPTAVEEVEKSVAVPATEEECFVSKLMKAEKPSVEELVQELRARMLEQNQESERRRCELMKRKDMVVVSCEEKMDETPAKQEEKEEEERDEEEAVIEAVEPMEPMEPMEEEATIENVTPPLFTTSVVPTKHMIMTINKNGLSPRELLELPRLLGFRYIHPDTDTSAKRVLFGISHAFSDVVTGRCPLAHDSHVNYEDDSDEEEVEDDIQGDDCNDTESDESEVETANRLDYGDGFLAEEDLNIGDANLSAEEKSALVFRSVSGNKGKLNEEIKLSNQPFVLSCAEGVVMGVDLRACRCIINDPAFFSEMLQTMKKQRLEVSEKEATEESGENANQEGSRRKMNMSEKMARELAELVQGKSYTISQIDEMMQEKYPGLPKRQVCVVI